MGVYHILLHVTMLQCYNTSLCKVAKNAHFIEKFRHSRHLFHQLTTTSSHPK